MDGKSLGGMVRYHFRFHVPALGNLRTGPPANVDSLGRAEHQFANRDLPGVAANRDA